MLGKIGPPRAREESVGRKGRAGQSLVDVRREEFGRHPETHPIMDSAVLGWLGTAATATGH